MGSIRKIFRCKEIKIKKIELNAKRSLYEIIFLHDSKISHILKIDKITLIHLRTALKKHKEAEKC